jgi:hypothetical protein
MANCINAISFPNRQRLNSWRFVLYECISHFILNEGKEEEIMTKRYLILMVAAASLFFSQFPAFGVDLAGKPDQASGSNWQSAYLDLDPIRDFKKGDRIVIRVEGSAEWVKVRLLPEMGNPSQPTGIVGSKMKVPAGGKLIVTLPEDRPRIRQISVHAGKEAWGSVLNPNGGDIKILGIDANP